MVRTKTTVSNEVFLDNDGVIHSVYHGAQTGNELQRTIERIMKIMGILLRDDKPIRLLVDIRNMEGYDQAGRLVEMHARTILPFWKLAYVTSPEHPASENISRKLTLMSGRRKEIRYFQREDDAIGWLNVEPKIRRGKIKSKTDHSKVDS
jgi:hypothetical protein